MSQILVDEFISDIYTMCWQTVGLKEARVVSKYSPEKEQSAKRLFADFPRNFFILWNACTDGSVDCKPGRFQSYTALCDKKNYNFKVRVDWYEIVWNRHKILFCSKQFYVCICKKV